MSETVDTLLGEHPDDEKGKRYISEIFGPNSPLTFRRTLDTRGYSQTGAEVFQVGIADPESTPARLGEWDDNYTMGIPQNPNTWVTSPSTECAMKVVNLESKSSGFERRALLTGTAVFGEHAPFRPVRLYGYGRGQVYNPTYNEHEDKGYFLEELVPPEYETLHTYVEKKGELSPLEATQLAIHVSTLLQPLHELGITHGDLEDEKGKKTGKEAHIFIDPTSGNIRLIDWSHSVSRDIDSKYFQSTLYLDHIGIGQLLQYGDFSRYSSAVQELLKKIYLFSGNEELDDKDAEPPEYPRDASGTRAQYEDMQELLLLLQQEEKK